MAQPRTKPGTKKLSEAAKLVVAPSGITSTAWPAVRDICSSKLGVGFDPWQDGAGRLILAKRQDGKLASMIGGIGMSLPRQVGKTHLIGAITFALCILRPGMLVVWSAHHARTHGETFLAMQEFAKRRKVRPFIAKVFVGSGDEEIRFANGSRILFGARERGFGRGIPGVDMLVSDEAQIMTDKALDAQLATMNTSQFGLAISIGTPPRPDDPSEAFTRMRTEAWAGELKDGAWIEFGADGGAALDDRKQWARANPSFPHRTPVESILRLQRKLAPDSFRREGLGIWDEVMANMAPPAIDFARWKATEVPAAPTHGPVTFGVKFSADGTRVALAAAVRPDVGPVHVEGIESRLTVDGTRWLVNWLAARDAMVVIDGKAGSGALVGALRRQGVAARRLHRPTVDEVITAHAEVVNAVLTGDLSHLDDEALADQVGDAIKRPIGKSGGWGIQGCDGGDVTLLEAAFLAAWGAKNLRPVVAAGGGRISMPT